MTSTVLGVFWGPLTGVYGLVAKLIDPHEYAVLLVAKHGKIFERFASGQCSLEHRASIDLKRRSDHTDALGAFKISIGCQFSART